MASPDPTVIPVIPSPTDPGVSPDDIANAVTSVQAQEADTPTAQPAFEPDAAPEASAVLRMAEEPAPPPALSPLTTEADSQIDTITCVSCHETFPRTLKCESRAEWCARCCRHEFCADLFAQRRAAV